MQHKTMRSMKIPDEVTKNRRNTYMIRDNLVPSTSITTTKINKITIKHEERLTKIQLIAGCEYTQL